jgi:4,5-dihydroxyphthalate decarboxylase
MAKLALTLACGDYDRTVALRTGAVRPEGVELEVLALEPEEMFFRMARRRDFDAAEFSLATYTVLRGRGEPLIAIPVFPSFAFRHQAIFVRDDAGIDQPRDLIGKRVGVPKYHMTAAVWIRGILEDDYGVSPGDLEWVEGGEGAAVKEVDVSLPAGLRHRTVPGDRTLGQLFPDFRRVERAYYEKTGIFPIMHTVVLKEELARAHPWLPTALYEAFVEAKRLAYRRLADTAVLPYALPWLVAEVEETRALMGDDPFPYGVRRNRKTVETLADYSFRQGLAPRRLSVEELFSESLLGT